MRWRASTSGWLRLRLISSYAGQNNGPTVGKFSYKRQVSAHGFDRLPESGKQQIAALFEARNTVLGDTEGFGNADLRKLASVPEFAQSHFLGDELSGAGLDLLALGGTQLPDDVIHVHRHDYLPSSSAGPGGRRNAHLPCGSARGRTASR